MTLDIVNSVGVISVFFENTVLVSIKHGSNKNYPDIPSIGNRPVQKVEVGESTRHKCIKFSDKYDNEVEI